jgi:N4-gp56 family major capsid protein
MIAPAPKGPVTTASWYGAHILHDEEVQYTTYHPVINYFSERLGYQAGISINDLTRTEQASGLTTVVRPGAHTADSTITASDIMDFALFAKGLATLQANNAPPAENGAYVALMHPFVYWDFVQDDQVQNAFREAAEAEGVNPYRNGYMGQIGNCKLYVSSRALVTADAGSGSVDIYSTFMFGSLTAVAA